MKQSLALTLSPLFRPPLINLTGAGILIAAVSAERGVAGLLSRQASRPLRPLAKTAVHLAVGTVVVKSSLRANETREEKLAKAVADARRAEFAFGQSRAQTNAAIKAVWRASGVGSAQMVSAERRADRLASKLGKQTRRIQNLLGELERLIRRAVKAEHNEAEFRVLADRLVAKVDSDLTIPVDVAGLVHELTQVGTASAKSDEKTSASETSADAGPGGSVEYLP